MSILHMFSHFKLLTSLHLEESCLQHIHQDSFVELTNLTCLSIVDCNLTSIDPNLFSNLRSLKELSLCSNGLENMHEDTFKHLTCLTVLNLNVKTTSQS